MKCKLTLEIDIPDGMIPEDPQIPNYEFNGFTWEMATLRDIVHEGIIGYTQKCHSMDAVRWYCKVETFEGDARERAKSIVAQHNAWVDALNDSMETFTLEKL